MGSDEYRRFAHECLKMANTTRDPTTRATFMQMAQVWHRLADQAEKNDRDEKDRRDDENR